MNAPCDCAQETLNAQYHQNTRVLYLYCSKCGEIQVMSQTEDDDYDYAGGLDDLLERHPVIVYISCVIVTSTVIAAAAITIVAVLEGWIK